MPDLWKIDVCIAIMKAAATGTIRESEIVSSIARNSMASRGTIKDCLGALIEIGFVDHDMTRMTCKTTNRGMIFTSVFDELSAAYVDEDHRSITSVCRVSSDLPKSPSERL